jgi:nucleosome binding factor SPN SPT16 subunit
MRIMGKGCRGSRGMLWRQSVGGSAQEKPAGKIAELWSEALGASGLPTADASAGLAAVFSVKDAQEIINIKKAGLLCASALKNFLLPEIEGEAHRQES